MRRWHLASVFGLLVVGVLFAGKVAGFEPRFNADSFPAAAIPVIEASAPARLFTYDQWGDYLIYRFPTRKVFVDGRSDFYGTELIDHCLHIINGRFDWLSDLTRFQVDAVLLKPDAPAATLLKQTPGWQILLDDGKVILFQKRATATTGPSVAELPQRLSTVSNNGENNLGAVAGLQVDGFNSKLNIQERRSS